MAHKEWGDDVTGLQTALVKALEYRAGCKACGGIGNASTPWDGPCAACNGTGKVPFFQLKDGHSDRLRDMLDAEFCFHDICDDHCAWVGEANDCAGRGWLPCAFDVLLEAVVKRWPHSDLTIKWYEEPGFKVGFDPCYPTSHTYWGTGATPALAVLDAVCIAAKVEGAT